MARCPICLHTPPADSFTTGCNHTFCPPCLRAYLEQLIVQQRYPLPCPLCQVLLDDSYCLELLAPSWQDKLTTLLVEKRFHRNLRYCANAHCGTPFDFERVRRLAGFRDEFKVRCLFCRTDTCVKCRIKWHSGRSCEQAAVQIRRELRRGGWQRCPQCRHLIEKHRADCNKVRCMCGCLFCYLCGEEYVRRKPACSCPRFGDDVPEWRPRRGGVVRRVLTWLCFSCSDGNTDSDESSEAGGAGDAEGMHEGDEIEDGEDRWDRNCGRLAKGEFPDKLVPSPQNELPFTSASVHPVMRVRNVARLGRR